MPSDAVAGCGEARGAVREAARMPMRGLKWTVVRVCSAPAWWAPVTIGVATGQPQGVIWGCRKDATGEEQGSRGPSPGRAEDNIMVERIIRHCPEE